MIPDLSWLRRLQLLVGGLLLCACCSGCLERSDASLPATRVRSSFKVPAFAYAGSFGGGARELTGSRDPWQQSYTPGAFLSLAGLCATDSEVWTTDLGLSRIQIFGHDGSLLRTIGSGVPLAGTLPSDEFLYTEEQTRDPGRDPKWEDSSDGLRWSTDRNNLFKAADVFVVPGGFWISDQMLSSGYAERQRSPALRNYYGDGQWFELPVDGMLLWPNYLAVDPAQGSIAAGEDWGNVLWIGAVTPEGNWELTRPNNFTTAFRSIMHVRVNNARDPRFQFLMRIAGNAGNDFEKFDQVGGMAFFQGKLLVCDRANRRIKIFETRKSMLDRWGKLIKVIVHRKRDGSLRFLSPRDIDISSEGLIYLLDSESREIAVLTPDFERLTSIPLKEAEDARAISLSPNGRHIFVSDPPRGKVHHYAAP